MGILASNNNAQPAKLSTASQLYAMSQGAKCQGSEECHWCLAPCERRWLHDDDLPIPFVRSKSTAKRPSSLYVCTGCWLYRMPRITVRYLNGKLKDRQSPEKHSWLITEQDAFSLDPTDSPAIYNQLLSPPVRFALSFLTDRGTNNLLQLQLLNDLDTVLADTPLHFTIDNIPHTYTTYELEEALRHGVEGKLPGVRALIEHLGPYQIPEEKVKRGRGRPKTEEVVSAEKLLKKVVSK